MTNMKKIKLETDQNHPAIKAYKKALEIGFKKKAQCALTCGDGTGKKPEQHVLNCPNK